MAYMIDSDAYNLSLYFVFYMMMIEIVYVVF